jgi:hypothetical protein
MKLICLLEGKFIPKYLLNKTKDFINHKDEEHRSNLFVNRKIFGQKKAELRNRWLEKIA